MGKVMPDRSPTLLLIYSFLVFFPSFTLAMSFCMTLHQITGALFYLGRNCQYGPVLNGLAVAEVTLSPVKEVLLCSLLL